MKQKIFTSVLVAATMGLSASAMAAPSITNLDGTHMPFDGFDWAKNGTAISTPIPEGGLSVGDAFTTYFFASAVSITDPAGNAFEGLSGLASAATGGALGANLYQYTVVASFNEQVSSIDGGVVNFSTTGGAWSIYYDHAGLDGTRASMIAGTGFDDGVQLLWGDVNVQDIGSFNPATSSGEFHFSGNVVGTNSTYINPDMIKTVAFGTLQFGPNTTGWNPADARPNGNGTATAIVGNALQFQADGNQSFTPSEVPEPGVLALLGLGMFGLFATTRRKNNLVA